MRLKLAGKAASMLLSTFFLFPNMAFANLNGNDFVECDRGFITDTRYCNNVAVDSSENNNKPGFFRAFPFTIGGIVISIFAIYLLYNMTMILILILRLLVDGVRGIFNK